MANLDKDPFARRRKDTCFKRINAKLNSLRTTLPSSPILEVMPSMETAKDFVSETCQQQQPKKKHQHDTLQLRKVRVP